MGNRGVCNNLHRHGHSTEHTPRSSKQQRDDDGVTSDKLFSKKVRALDSPHIGYVIRETEDKIVVYGEGDERYDILKTEIQKEGKSILIGLPLYEVVRRYKRSRKSPLPTAKPVAKWTSEEVNLATYEKKHPNALFNKSVKTREGEHVGHVMKETKDTIVIFGHYFYRFDVPKSSIFAVGKNVILNMDYPHVFHYRVDRNTPLPAEESVAELAEEQ